MAEGAVPMCWMEMQWTHVETAALLRKPEGNCNCNYRPFLQSQDRSVL